MANPDDNKTGKRPKPWRSRLVSYLIAIVAFYGVYCTAVFFFQAKLIFPASMAGQASEALPTLDTEVIELPTDEGTTAAWFIPVPGASADTPAPPVVFFHGNAELIDHQHATIELYHRLGLHVLMVEYRGYGQSEGTPSETHIVQDSLAVLAQVLQREDVANEKLVLHGRSIGGGLAAQVALQAEPSALIVESTFTSVSGMAMRYGVPPFIVTSPLESEDAFEQLSVPILIMHGERDSIVPISHAHALEQAAEDTTLILFDAGHNDLPNGPDVQAYHRAVEELLRRAGIIAPASGVE